MTISVQGLNQLVVEFGAESVEAPVRARKIIQATARKVSSTMKAFAPVEEGELRDSISFETKLTPGGAEGEIGPTATRDGFPYPREVEYGNSRMAPQAFAGPALDRHSSEFVTAMLTISEL